MSFYKVLPNWVEKSLMCRYTHICWSICFQMTSFSNETEVRALIEGQCLAKRLYAERLGCSTGNSIQILFNSLFLHSIQYTNTLGIHCFVLSIVTQNENSVAGSANKKVDIKPDKSLLIMLHIKTFSKDCSRQVNLCIKCHHS